jgi:hypothetical protein
MGISTPNFCWVCCRGGGCCNRDVKSCPVSHGSCARACYPDYGISSTKWRQSPGETHRILVLANVVVDSLLGRGIRHGANTHRHGQKGIMIVSARPENSPSVAWPASVSYPTARVRPDHPNRWASLGLKTLTAIVGCIILAGCADDTRLSEAQIRLLEQQTSILMGTSLRDVQKEGWPDIAIVLGAEAVRVQQQGVEVVMNKFFVQESGFLVRRAGVGIDTNPGSDPRFVHLGGNTFAYRVKG